MRWDSRVLVPLLTAGSHEHKRVVRQVDLVRAHRPGVELGRCGPEPERTGDAERQTRNRRVRPKVCQLVRVEADAGMSASVEVPSAGSIAESQRCEHAHSYTKDKGAADQGHSRRCGSFVAIRTAHVCAPPTPPFERIPRHTVEILVDRVFHEEGCLFELRWHFLSVSYGFK